MRLERQGWVERQRMVRGNGTLLFANRNGVRAVGLDVSAPAPPGINAWAHLIACSWTAAWCTRTGAEWRGPREARFDVALRGEVERAPTGKRGRAAHHPDLALWVDRGLVPIEIALRVKNAPRLDAVFGLYRRWCNEGRIAGLLVVTRTDASIDVVEARARRIGLPANRLRTETLATIRSWAEAPDGGRSAASGRAA